MPSWNGDFHFGDTWTAYRGPAGDNSAHAHAATQVTIGLTSPVVILDRNGEPRAAAALVVRAGTTHLLRPSSSVLVIHCDPYSVVANHLGAHSSTDAIFELHPWALERLNPNAALPDVLPSLPARPAPVDPRLLTAIELIDADVSSPLSELARACGSSPARLRDLARKELGIPLSSWRLWRSLRRAGVALSQGASLSDAALAGGFSDQAHFTRTMRRMMGITPGMALSSLQS